MTVPGKGGRPRKWSSDADRVRAFRARARGVEEPAAVQAGDAGSSDSGTAWAQLAQLGEVAQKHRDAIRSLERDLRTARSAVEELVQRCRNLEGLNRQLRLQLERAESPSQRGETEAVPQPPAPVATQNLSRAERRARDRNARRRR